MIGILIGGMSALGLGALLMGGGGGKTKKKLKETAQAVADDISDALDEADELGGVVVEDPATGAVEVVEDAEAVTTPEDDQDDQEAAAELEAETGEGAIEEEDILAAAEELVAEDDEEEKELEAEAAAEDDEEDDSDEDDPDLDDAIDEADQTGGVVVEDENGDVTVVTDIPVPTDEDSDQDDDDDQEAAAELEAETGEGAIEEEDILAAAEELAAEDDEEEKELEDEAAAEDGPGAGRPVDLPPPVDTPAPTPAATLPEPAAEVLITEETAPIPADALELVRLLLDAERSKNWKGMHITAVREFQSGRNMKPDGMAGPGTMLLLAAETGTAPIVRFWPSGSWKGSKKYTDYLAAIAAIPVDASREQGQGFGTPPKPITTFAEV